MRTGVKAWSSLAEYGRSASSRLGRQSRHSAGEAAYSATIIPDIVLKTFARVSLDCHLQEPGSRAGIAETGCLRDLPARSAGRVRLLLRSLLRQNGLSARSSAKGQVASRGSNAPEISGSALAWPGAHWARRRRCRRQAQCALQVRGSVFPSEYRPRHAIRNEVLAPGRRAPNLWQSRRRWSRGEVSPSGCPPAPLVPNENSRPNRHRHFPVSRCTSALRGRQHARVFLHGSGTPKTHIISGDWALAGEHSARRRTHLNLPREWRGPTHLRPSRPSDRKG